VLQESDDDPSITLAAGQIKTYRLSGGCESNRSCSAYWFVVLRMLDKRPHGLGQLLLSEFFITKVAANGAMDFGY
jgi:hypothetical protein